MDDATIKTCKEALKQFGTKPQMVKCIEELSELQKELCKYHLGQGSRARIVEELADVEIMLEQMKVGLNIGFYELTEAKSKKLCRLSKKLKTHLDDPASSEEGCVYHLKTKKTCESCLYSSMTQKEIEVRGDDPCNTCDGAINWELKGVKEL